MQFSRQTLSPQHKTCGFLLLTREYKVSILQFLRTLCSFNLLSALFPVPLPGSSAHLSTYESSHTVQTVTHSVLFIGSLVFIACTKFNL